MENNLFSKFVKFVNRRSNNKGSSVVLVIVAIAFVGTLVSMSAFMSYYNWMGKYNDKQTKVNFYSAEEALAEINIGLQNVVSNAMTMAYSYALQNSTGDDMSTRKHKFEIMYEEQLIKQLQGVNSTHYNKALIESYLKNTAWDPAKMTGTKIETVDGVENIIYKKDGGIILRNIKLMHTDQNGYVTYLSTDIYLRLPNINLAVSVGVPEIENCSIIANNVLDVTGNSNIKVSGNVYGGKEGLLSSGDTALSFIKRDTDPESTMYRLIAGSVTVENSNGGSYLNVSSNYDLWTENVQVESGNLFLNGSSFVRDDLTIDGRDSRVTLAGSYYGYGDELYKSANSSSILVNGGNTSLDFSGLNNLMLAGNAYIGARHYDANTTTDDDYIENLDEEVEEGEEGGETTPTTTPTYAENNKDLMMGESLGVKSNQLMYMVPTECMGYYAGTTKQYLAKNPITYSEYLTLTTSYKYKMKADGTVETDLSGNPILETDSNGNPVLQFEEVNLGIIANKIGKTLTSIGATYKPVFRKINGTVLVYYYLDFTSEQAANDFFQLYYRNDKENVDSYIKMYIKNLEWNDALNNANSTLHLAGNAVKFGANNEISLVEDTLQEDVVVEDVLNGNRDKWYDTYVAYSKKMLTNTSLLTSDQLANDIYTNLVVDDYEFGTMVPSGTTKYFTNGNVKALAINNKNVSPELGNLDAGELNGVNFVIATGDVTLNADYNGLVISGGTVKLGTLCNRVTNDSMAVKKALAAKDNVGSFCAANLLKDGEAYISQMNESVVSTSVNDVESKIDREEDYIRLGDLISYENWTKR